MGRALFLDLDDTLLDGSGFGESILRTCKEIEKVHPELDAATLVAANGEAWKGYWPEIQSDWTLGRRTGAEVSRETWRRTLALCGCTDERVLELACATHAATAEATYRLFDDARHLLTTLADSGVRLTLITNGSSDVQRGKLRALGIERVFHATVISGELGIAKPDPRIFAHALELCQVKPEHVWHVGDNLVTDVGGANAAGIGSVWLNRRGSTRREEDPTPRVEVSTLSDLPKALGW